MSAIMVDAPQTHSIAVIAAKLRLDILRMIFDVQSGHPGSSFSCLDILCCLWFEHMKHTVADPAWAERDRFVMSKGHGAPALYAVLMEAGYIPKTELLTLRKIHSNLQGHPASKYIQGVDVSTGSLGQGLSCAVGMALGLRLNHSKARIYALLGDGECQEGNTWEGVMSAAHHGVNRLTAIVDRNQLQIDGHTEKIKALGNLESKFEAFGWNVLSMPGHDYPVIVDKLRQADELAETSDKPTVIIAHTTKGRGVSFMENQAGWHGKAPNQAQFEQAMAELENNYKHLSN